VGTLSSVPTIVVITEDRHEGTRLAITMPRSLLEEVLEHGEGRWGQGEGLWLDFSPQFDTTKDLARVEFELADE